MTTESIQNAIDHLDHWITLSGWVGYEPFDGLSAPLLRRLTLEVPLLRIVLQQTVRRLPFNIRPALGITRKHCNQAMGYFASGYLRLYQATARQDYLDKAVFCLADLRKNNSPGYSGYTWGNYFDYQSRGDWIPKGVPTAVWTSFIGCAFVDAYELLADPAYLEVARSACEFTLRDLSIRRFDDQSVCLSYIPRPFPHVAIHNANVLGASLLARVYRYTRESELLENARQAMRYTMDHQRPDGSWYYGEGLRFRWVDGYHTGFVLDALYWYMQSTGDDGYGAHLRRGMDYYRQRLFEGAIPKHYSNATYPVDIQPVAQAIQTFALIPEEYHGDPAWAEQVAGWTIEHMHDPSGYFYFRKYRHMMNKTPMLHWGQATMLAALAILRQSRAVTANPTPTVDKEQVYDQT